MPVATWIWKQFIILQSNKLQIAMSYALKTKINDTSVSAFLDNVEDEKKRNDCYAVLKIMQEVSGYEPKMWGTAIIGFGGYHYKYATGHEGDMCLIGFSPRKANITLYLYPYPYLVQQESVIKDLGKFKTGKGCLYINKMDDINIPVLRALIAKSIEQIQKAFPSR
jgi:hypothetical protein